MTSKLRERSIYNEKVSSSTSIKQSLNAHKPRHDTRDHTFKRVQYNSVVSELRADTTIKKIERIEMTNIPTKSHSTEQIRINPDRKYI